MGVSGRRGAALLVAASLALATVPASARAEGLFDFLFGGGGQSASRPLPQPDQGFFDAPDLVVRPRAKRHRTAPGFVSGSQRYNVADLKGVTIYNDKTLSRGDAVMTPTGLKVFDGTPGSLHTGDDFVAIADSRGVAKGVRAQLIALDAASRPALAR